MADLVTRRPNVMQGYPLLIEALRSLGRLPQAAQIIEQNLETAPQNAQLHYFLGLIFNQQQKPAEARQSFTTALEKAPGLTPAMTELVSLDLRERKHPEALRGAQALIAKSPTAAVPRFLEAKAYAALGQWNEVEESLVKAIELDSKLVGVYGLLADSFAARQQQPDVVDRVGKFLAKRSHDELATVVGAQTYTRLKKFTNARDTYEKFLTSKPDSSLVLNNLANLYSEQLDEPERALELARKARALHPGAPEIADTLGWILYKQEQFEESWALLQESAGKLAGNPEVQFHFGMASLKQGKSEAALTALRIAANASGDFSGKDEAKRQLALLDKGAPSAPAPTDNSR
jgi:tetratricopeptide (TPR) repeat protein